MDLVEGVEEEEEHGAPSRHCAVLVPVLVDALLCLPGLDHLLADLIRHTLGLLQGLDERHILCDVPLCCAQLEQKFILKLQWKMRGQCFESLEVSNRATPQCSA